MKTLVARFDGKVLIPELPVTLPMNQLLQISVTPFTGSTQQTGSEIDEENWLCAAAASPAFAFLKDEPENIYRATDGKPFHDQG